MGIEKKQMPNHRYKSGRLFRKSFIPVRSGEIVILMLPLAINQWLRTAGEVRHFFSNGFSIRFVGLSDKEQVLLQEFILRHGKNPSTQPTASTEQKKAEKPKERAPSAENTESRKSGEFEQFIEDLFGESDERKIS